MYINNNPHMYIQKCILYSEYVVGSYLLQGSLQLLQPFANSSFIRMNFYQMSSSFQE